MVVDLYNGAYGPTLRLVLDNRRELEQLVCIFGGAAEGKRFVVTAAVDVLMNQPLEEVVLARDETGRNRQRVRVAGDGRKVSIAYSEDDWRDCVDFVRALGESGRSGHQYLPRDRSDDALIEISFGE